MHKTLVKGAGVPIVTASMLSAVHKNGKRASAPIKPKPKKEKKREKRKKKARKAGVERILGSQRLKESLRLWRDGAATVSGLDHSVRPAEGRGA